MEGEIRAHQNILLNSRLPPVKFNHPNTALPQKQVSPLIKILKLKQKSERYSDIPRSRFKNENWGQHSDLRSAVDELKLASFTPKSKNQETFDMQINKNCTYDSQIEESFGMGKKNSEKLEVRRNEKYVKKLFKYKPSRFLPLNKFRVKRKSQLCEIIKEMDKGLRGMFEIKGNQIREESALNKISKLNYKNIHKDEHLID